MPLSPEVQIERRKGISGTDAAPIMGVSPYKSAADVWIEKKKPELLAVKESKALYWGTRLEQTVAEEYALVTGQQLEASRLIRNKNVKWMMCSPDRIITGSRKGLECKTASDRMSYLWGPSGTDMVPQEYVIQCQHCMLVSQFHEWDLAALIGGQEFRIYHLFADKELWKLMYEQEKEFYTRYIAGNETPSFDWGKDVAEFVRKKYPRHKAGIELNVDENGDEILKKALLELLQARGSLATTKKIETTQKSLVQAYMRDSETLKWDERKLHISWRSGRDSIKVDWQKVVEELLPHVSLPAEEKQALIGRHSKSKDGVRRFLVKDESGDGDDEE